MTAIARLTGLLAGLSLALVALAQARVPAGTGEVPAYASLKAERAIELAVSPAGRELLRDRRIEPGSSVSGAVEVSNLTSARLTAEPRLRVLGDDRPGALPVELTAGTRTLYSGPLADFDAKLRLRPRESKTVRLRLELARDERDLQGRSATLVMRFRVRKAEP